MGERRKTAAFGIGEPQAAVTELSFEHAVLREEIRDDLLLVTLDPASDHGDQDVEKHGVPRVDSRDVMIRSSIHPT